MKIIEINEAEAIIEPFFDGGTSDYTDPDPRYRVLDEYQVQALNGAVARAEQAVVELLQAQEEPAAETRFGGESANDEDVLLREGIKGVRRIDVEEVGVAGLCRGEG